MQSTVTLSTWIFLLLLLFSAIMVLDRILLPGVRWFIRRRVNRVVEEVSARLDIEIRPFQLTRRQALIDQLVYDDQVMEAVRKHAAEQEMPTSVAQSKAVKYAKEIVPAFNAYMYFRLGYWIARKVARLVYRVRVGFFDNDGLKDIAPGSCVVFVMNHRSNMDYILVSFLVAEKTALSYAVGEWARIWPLQTLIRAMGAFFVRRNSGIVLYRRVLERYVAMATRAGVCQAVFPEGGLSKDGAMREPRLGFIDYMLRDYHPDKDKDIVFVPVGINYDRVLEDRTLLRKLDKQAEKRSMWFVTKTTLRFIYKMLSLSRKNRWRRFGYACVNFGKPLSAREYCQQKNINFSKLDADARFKEVGQIAELLMKKISEVVPVLPVPLMSWILLVNKNDWKSELELKSQAMERISILKNAGAPINISASACEGVLTGAMDLLVGRGLVNDDNNLFRVKPDSEEIIAFYANSIRYWNTVIQQPDAT